MKSTINFDKIKLKWKIFIYLLGFCALLLTILWLFQIIYMTDTYKFIRRQQIQEAIKQVEANINSENLSSILKSLSDEMQIHVMPEKEFIAPDYDPAVPMQKDKPRPETITQTKTFTLESGESLSLTFHAIISPVDATVTTLRYQFYIIAAIMIILSILLAFIIAKRVSSPIEDITKSALALSIGNYDVRFFAKGFLEINALSSTLNTAAHELSKTDSLRRELMANISHDLRTPLSLIYSYAEIMHDFPDEITPEKTQIIMDEAMRLTSLVNDVLDISKLETGIIKLNLSTFNLTALLRATVERMGELVKKDSFEIRFEYEKDVHLEADEVKINQAFYNLLINAINYSKDDKLIIVKQEIFDGKVKISVIDRGAGINPDDLPYIWDRYYKVDKKHKRAITGTGLGLSIVKKVLDLHEAWYGVQPNGQKGSIFWFILTVTESTEGR